MNSSQGSVHPSQARMRTVLLALGVFFLSGQFLFTGFQTELEWRKDSQNLVYGLNLSQAAADV